MSDDYTLLVRQNGRLVARPPTNLAGKMEVRGIGIVAMPNVTDIPVAMLVAIVPVPPRLPTDGRLRRIAGVELREVVLPALEPSAPIKVEMALRQRLDAR